MNRIFLLSLSLLALLAPASMGQGFSKASGSLYTRIEGTELQISLQIRIDPGFHLYHHELGAPDSVGKPLTVELTGEGVEFDKLWWPEPHRYEQKGLGKGGGDTFILGHSGKLVLYGHGTLAEGVTDPEITVELDGLTCEDSGSCFPYSETLKSKGAGRDKYWKDYPAAYWDEASASDPEAVSTEQGAEPTEAEPTEATPSEAMALPADQDGDGGLLALILAAIGGGIFALLMPCTYPMIPITISFFTKQAEARHGSILPLSLLYGAGIVLIFVVIGLLVGPVIMTFATHPVTNIVMGAMFVFFAAVLFGALTLNPPQFLMRMAGKASMKGGLVGVFLMGMTLVLTSFTCTAPFVGSLLAAATKDGAGLGRVVIGMGTFGLTMAIPFVFLSLVPGKLKSMPTSGEWMDTLKITLGFIELAAALKFFSNADMVWHWRAISREMFLLMWAAIFILAAAYLFGFIKLKGHVVNEIGAGRMFAGTGILLFGLYCLHGYNGHRLDSTMTAIIPPYSSAIGGVQGHEADAGSHKIIVDDYEEAKRVALSDGKPLLINFTGFQ